MSQAAITQDTSASLTGLLVPLADRMLLVPNVAVAELIPYRAPQSAQGTPSWFLGQVSWRDLTLPLLSFEAASDGQPNTGSGSRVAVLNALGGRDHVKFIALLVQGIPRSVKVDPNLARSDVPLAPLELDAVNLGDVQARIPDLIALEQKLADAGLI
ncbi:chemotaxis protein CheW [Stutzerimonas zhaodongensis]|uniref:Chemotaxis protein CheW n=1 Tax=Stutzerimonas zhaodongensis TaxID=1176257 RepID=A0A365PUD1_9GAMM|nr:chemotaxis protein CheW [Stutzerimonas zhaodongensis]QWV18343.1 chemotaxis protein CheW [Stutzerimonas zhaodongensis]RBA58088.1 chemotaxis protein CheW [Stutzerimonas zhaodongensis]